MKAEKNTSDFLYEYPCPNPNEEFDHHQNVFNESYMEYFLFEQFCSYPNEIQENIHPTIQDKLEIGVSSTHDFFQMYKKCKTYEPHSMHSIEGHDTNKNENFDVLDEMDEKKFIDLILQDTKTCMFNCFFCFFCFFCFPTKFCT